jgi:hypothetical protein
MEDYFNPEKIVIRSISKTVAKEIIIKNHYSHKWTLCQVAYGVFYKAENSKKLIQGNDEELIGCCVYGNPVGRSASDSFSKLIKPNEVFELTRLFIQDGYGKNLESYVISQTFKRIKKEFPQVKIILSYSDQEQNHRGIIYQASGFYYQGCDGIALMPNFSISLSGPPNYKWIHSRTVNSRWGSHNVEQLKKAIGQTFYRKKESTKHRYFYILTNKIEKKKILNNLKHPLKTYPKGTEFKEEIEKIVVDDTTENKFFS